MNNINKMKGGERMGTDAILFSRNVSQSMADSTRMDRLQKKSDDFDAAGFGSDKTSQSNRRFQETYNEVARSNSTARETTEATADSRLNRRNHRACDEQTNSRRNDSRLDSTGRSADDYYNDIESRDVSSADHYVNTEGVDRNDFTDETDDTLAQNQQASETIKQALIEISGTLELNIVPGLENVKFENPDSETVEQISQIVHDLKSILGALEAAVANGESIDTGKKVIENSEAGELVNKLKEELFKIEIGVNMLGKSSEVQSLVALKANADFSSGIPQAIDPAQIQMSSEQMRKILNKALDSSEKGSSVSQLVKKINEIVGDCGVDNDQVSVADVSTDAAQKSGPGSYETTVYRALLKLEKQEQAAQENAQAAVAPDNSNLAGAAEPILARDVSIESSKVTEQVVSITEIAGKVNQQTISQEIRPPVSLPKTIEQSVINQVTEKLNAAIRSGVTEVRVQLRPESLGEVTVKIRIEGDVVTARMQVENQQVKAIVENGFQSLRDSLSQHNLQAGTLEVDIQSGDHGQNAYDQRTNYESDGQQSDKSSDGTDDSMDLPDDTVILGETGKLYGSNTVEYFA